MRATTFNKIFRIKYVFGQLIFICVFYDFGYFINFLKFFNYSLNLLLFCISFGYTAKWLDDHIFLIFSDKWTYTDSISY